MLQVQMSTSGNNGSGSIGRKGASKPPTPAVSGNPTPSVVKKSNESGNENMKAIVPVSSSSNVSYSTPIAVLNGYITFVTNYIETNKNKNKTESTNESTNESTATSASTGTSDSSSSISLSSSNFSKFVTSHSSTIDIFQKSGLFDLIYNKYGWNGDKFIYSADSNNDIKLEANSIDSNLFLNQLLQLKTNITSTN
jgi:hypothetical protein